MSVIPETHKQTKARQRAAAHDEAAVKEAQTRPLDESRSLGSLMKGLDTPNARDAMMERLVEKVIKDSNGLIDPSHHTLYIHTSHEEPSLHEKGNSKSALWDMSINPDRFKNLNLKAFEAVLAHELQHGQQPPGMPDRAAEYDSDDMARKIYGPEAVIAFLKKLSPINRKNIPSSDHPSAQERENHVLHPTSEMKDVSEISKPLAPAQPAKANEKGISSK